MKEFLTYAIPFAIILILSNWHAYRRGRHEGFMVGRATGALDATVKVTREYFMHIASKLPEPDEMNIKLDDEKVS